MIAGPVPEADGTIRVDSQQLVEDVRPHRRHARAARHKDHLRLALGREEVTVGPGDLQLAPRLYLEEE